MTFIAHNLPIIVNQQPTTALFKHTHKSLLLLLLVLKS